MAFIAHVIGLMVLASVQQHGRFVAGSPLDYGGRSTSAGFDCPDQKACTCSYVLNDYEVVCPPLKPMILVKVQPSTYVQIECMTMDAEAYLQLPTMAMGEIPTVQFRRCPLPAGGSSLQTILDRLGIKRIRTLVLTSYNTDLSSTLVRQHLHGFTDLERLIISGNGLSDLPEDLFNDVGNLTWLDLRSNKVHLPGNIFANLKKLEYLELGSNNLKTLEQGIFRNQRRLKQLNLWNNDLQNLTRDVFNGSTSVLELDLSANNLVTLEPDVFAMLANMTVLSLSANRFRSLPSGLFVANKNLSQFRLMENRVDMETLPAAMLANLTQLETVHLVCGLKEVPANLFQGSYNVKHLTMARNKLQSLPATLFADMGNALDLDLRSNLLTELDDMLFEATNSLQVLWLSHNQLERVSGTLFRGLRSIQEIHLGNNRLHTIHPNAFSNTPYLINLQLQNNNISFVNEDGGIQSVESESPFQHLTALRILNMRNNSMISILNDWNYINSNLEELDLSHNNLSSLNLDDIQFLARNIKVDLTHNSIREIDFSKYDVTYAFAVNRAKNNKIYLANNPLWCNCLIMHFIRVLNSQNSTLTGFIEIIPGDLKCAGPDRMAGRYAIDVQPQELLCLLDSPNSSMPQCPQNCSCFVRPNDKALLVNCSNADIDQVPQLPSASDNGLAFTELYVENNRIAALPSLANRTDGYAMVTEIHARNNSIIWLTGQNIPSHLKWLDLEANKLQVLNKSVLDTLNQTVSLRRLSLSHNPWYCDCAARDFLIFTQDQRNKIDDLKTIMCHDGSYLKENEIRDLCPEDQTIIIAVAVVMTLLGLSIGIAIALYYKYQQEIKVWLFAHNLLAWFVNEQEVDMHKKYDAFIAYSHMDMDFVTESIVPELENGTSPFKLCLHERDWLVGNAITESIAESVENSRRTLIVLTRNFVESEWGKMEFRVAHKKSLNENRARVIVIVCGDLKDIENENLDDELKAYLKTNTYIKWGDPWFWMKLRYAMPHPNGYKGSCTSGKGLLKTGIKRSVDDKLELIKPVAVTPPQMTTPPAEMASKNFHHGLNGSLNGSLNGHINGAFIINTNAKQSDV